MMELSAIKHLNTRSLVFAIIVALCSFASLLIAVLANEVVEKDYPDLIPPFTAWLPNNLSISIVIAAFFSTLLAIGAYLFLSHFNYIFHVLTRIQPCKLFPLEFRMPSIVRASAFIFLLWIPIIALMFPTGLTADTFNELYQFQTSAPTYYPTTDELINAEFIDHHPVFDTLLYGLFWQIGYLAGSQNTGIFALAIIQSVVLAAELGLLVCYLARIDVPYVLRLTSLIFFAWFPFFGHYACTVLKDTTHLTAFIPWIIMWTELARTRGQALNSKHFLTVFMVLGGLCIITKKIGVFLLVPCLIVLTIALRKQRVKVVLSGVATILTFTLILPSIVYPAIGGVAPGGRQEVIGPAIQQITALINEQPYALSKKEQEICNRVFCIKKAVSSYEAFRSDGAKSSFRTSATNTEIAEFLGVWITQGLKHPFAYLASTFKTSGMLYIPFLKLTYYSGEDLSGRASKYQHYHSNFIVSVAQPANLVALNDYLEFDSPESKISDLPLISLFFTEGFYGGWVPLFSILLTLFARHRTKNAPLYLTALFPFFLCVTFLPVSPVASPRYILPLLFTTPLMLGWSWFALGKQMNSVYTP